MKIMNSRIRNDQDDLLLRNTSPIHVKIMLFYSSNTDPGHIGVKAWIPDTALRYSIHFIRGLDSRAHWATDLHRQNAEYDIELHERSFTFESSRTLAELESWHKNSPYFHHQDWRYKNNCADAMLEMLEDFFGYSVEPQPSCFQTPFSTCFWSTARITMPRAVFERAKNAVKNEGEILELFQRHTMK